MSTFLDDETSSSKSRPRDIFVIATPTKIYRHTSHPVNVDYAGDTYTALTMDRGALQLAQDATAREMIVYLPITHELVQRYFATGIPEHGVTVTYYRLQEISGTAIQQCVGYAQSMSVDGHIASIRVPSVTDDALKISLPVVRAQKLCNHVLFDARCSPNPSVQDGPSPDFFSGLVAVTGQAGRVLSIDSLYGRPDGWARFGRVVDPLSAQQRTVVEQVGTQLTLSEPFVGVPNGSNVMLFAGCAHTIAACRDTFNNVRNFGGHPHINNAVDPYNPVGIGIIQQV